MMRLITGNDDFVAAWAGQKLGVSFQPPYVAFGIVDDTDCLVGASIFNDRYPNGNIEWTHVGRGTLRPRILKEIAKYAFVDNKATRITAKTRRGNAIVRRLLPKGGFAYEGTQRRYFGPERADDALVFVLFRESAERWLR